MFFHKNYKLFISNLKIGFAVGVAVVEACDARDGAPTMAKSFVGALKWRAGVQKPGPNV